MMTSSSFWLLSIGYAIHGIAIATLIIGAIMLILWANKLKAKELKHIVIWTIVLGIIGVLLTAGFAFKAKQYHMGSWSKAGYKMMMDGEMQKEMKEMMGGDHEETK